MDKILVTCYKGPDLDGTACAIAYAEFLNKMGRDASCGLFDKIQAEPQFVLNYLNIKVPDTLETFEQAILVDASTIHGFPKEAVRLEQVVEIIDHRQGADLSIFPSLQKSQIELVGAAATLVAERFINEKISISLESAVLLHQAIVSNTMNFQANVTTERDKKAAENLKKLRNIPNGLTHEMFLAKSDISGNKLKENIEGNIARVDIGSESFLITQIEMVGVDALLEDRKNEVLAITKEEKCRRKIDKCFSLLSDLERARTTFLCDEPEVRNTLEGAIRIKFNGDKAIHEGLLMRKEITPMIKEYLNVK